MKKALFTLFIIMLFATVEAQWISNNMLNNSVVIAPNNQATPKIISDNDGGVIMVWQDNRTGSSSSFGDIYAQRFDKFGFKQWGDTNGLAIAVKPILERYYSICTDGKGGIIILWEDNPSPTTTIIKAQRVSKYGNKMWSDTGYSVAAYGNRQATPRVAYDNNGGCFYSYYSSEISSSDYEIKVNRLDSNGVNLWGTGIYICQSPGNPSDISVCRTSDDGFFIVWGDPRNSITNETDLYMQKVNSLGNALWQANGLPLCVRRFTQQYQNVLPDDNGGAFVAWTDRRDSISNDIYAARVRWNGTFPRSDTSAALVVDNFEQYRSELAPDMKGGAIITWYDYRNGPAFPFNIDIYAQRIDSTVNTKWTANGVNVCDAVLSQINPAIITDGNYGAIITWDDRRAGTSTYDIYGQRIDSAGVLKWGADDAPISIAAGNQYKPQMAEINNGFVTCFEDTRNGISNYDVFCQRADMNGNTLVFIQNNAGEVPRGFSLSQNYPNPFNPRTLVRFSLSVVSDVRLIIYDIKGQEVETLMSGRMQAGTYQAVWDGSGFPSGVYFCRMVTEGYTETIKMALVK
ncbi:MAG: T9SS type A sorting domain-containing protein [Ignavibacteria bacterium]